MNDKETYVSHDKYAEDMFMLGENIGYLARRISELEKKIDELAGRKQEQEEQP